MSTPATIHGSVTQPKSRVPRKEYYKNCFMLGYRDGTNYKTVAVPIPSEWKVSPNILTRDAKRKIATGALRSPYITTVYKIEWKYKYLTSAQFELLYNNYIAVAAKNKSVRIYVATMDSNRKGKVFCTPAYIEDGFEAPLYRVDPITHEHYYKDITFKIASLGGPDDKTNFWTKKSSFQNTSSKLNYSNFPKYLNGKYKSVDVVDSTDETGDA